eukprot:1785995-Amphidinium_carterae.1
METPARGPDPSENDPAELSHSTSATLTNIVPSSASNLKHPILNWDGNLKVDQSRFFPMCAICKSASIPPFPSISCHRACIKEAQSAILALGDRQFHLLTVSPPASEACTKLMRPTIA